jgi:hypothetical protein
MKRFWIAFFLLLFVTTGWVRGVWIEKGYSRAGKENVYPDSDGTYRIRLNEMEPLKIHFSNDCENLLSIDGYMVVGEQKKKLPVGSVLNRRGFFYWKPSTGFIGEYKLQFEASNRKYTFLIGIGPLPESPLNIADSRRRSIVNGVPGGAPFGSFDTPVEGSTVAGSAAVTGWVLDDEGVESVKIYRQEGTELVYIGDALFVEGARPDVAQAYPDYPNNTSAGWGYMLLSNFLPNGGNGTFVLYAVATDVSGKTSTLGTKTIYCDNANSKKPFGAIDTPKPGETVSGVYRVQGWALTPPPNEIPKNGTTISVKIDGVEVGTANYNNYRSDIGNYFPGYVNSSGAGAYFDLDTTGYSEGVHTLEWVVTDGNKNVDGVGSRFFTVEKVQGGDSKIIVMILNDSCDSRGDFVDFSINGRDMLKSNVLGEGLYTFDDVERAASNIYSVYIKNRFGWSESYNIYCTGKRIRIFVQQGRDFLAGPGKCTNGFDSIPYCDEEARQN